MIETVGSAAVLAQAYAATRRGGTIVTVGLPHPEQMLRSRRSASSPRSARCAAPTSARACPAATSRASSTLHREGRLPVERLLTHRIGLDEVNEAFDALASGEAVRQVVIF